MSLLGREFSRQPDRADTVQAEAAPSTAQAAPSHQVRAPGGQAQPVRFDVSRRDLAPTVEILQPDDPALQHRLLDDREHLGSGNAANEVGLDSDPTGKLLHAIATIMATFLA
jgi:hypothetical protein